MCTSKKDQQRDVACLGLKAVITEVEPERAPPLVAACVPPLVSGLRSDLLDVATNCMDALAEITARHGYAVPDPDALRKALMPELDENKPGIRKRAIQCLGE